MASQERVADLRIDAATEADAPVLLRLIRGLAEYERLLHRVVATEEALRTALCGLRPVAEAVIARVGDEAVGFAVYFPSFSPSPDGRTCIWRTCTSSRNGAVRAWAAGCSRTWRASRRRAAGGR
jgi:hypothetical protein